MTALHQETLHFLAHSKSQDLRIAATLWRAPGFRARACASTGRAYLQMVHHRIQALQCVDGFVG